MKIIIELLRDIPPAVWAALGGGLLALAGVLISNASFDRRLKTQLRHDAEQKERDRLTSTRRDIYLKAISELDDLVPKLVLIPGADPNDKGIDSFKSFFTAFSQLALVVDASTSTLVHELTGNLSLLIMRCMHSASPIMILKEKYKMIGMYVIFM